MNSYEIGAVAGMAIVTFGIRAILLVLAQRFKIPAHWEKVLLYVPPAVLTAITVPAVLLPHGEIQLGFQNTYLISALVALTAGLLFRKHALWAAIISGLAVFAILKLLI